MLIARGYGQQNNGTRETIKERSTDTLSATHSGTPIDVIGRKHDEKRHMKGRDRKKKHGTNTRRLATEMYTVALADPMP